MKTLKKIVTILAAAMMLGAFTLGVAQDKKSYTFTGKVEKVNSGDGTLTIDGDNVPGYMSAMKMDYKVDDPKVLKQVKPGDKIKATVYDGDYTLHKVAVDKK